MTAIGCCGIHLYRLGETVSIPLWGECGSSESFYPKIVSNFQRKLHTLCLLDIKVLLLNVRWSSYTLEILHAIFLNKWLASVVKSSSHINSISQLMGTIITIENTWNVIVWHLSLKELLMIKSRSCMGKITIYCDASESGSVLITSCSSSLKVQGCIIMSNISDFLE